MYLTSTARPADAWGLSRTLQTRPRARPCAQPSRWYDVLLHVIWHTMTWYHVMDDVSGIMCHASQMTWHMSHAMYHNSNSVHHNMSCVTCRIPSVTFHISYVTYPANSTQGSSGQAAGMHPCPPPKVRRRGCLERSQAANWCLAFPPPDPCRLQNKLSRDQTKQNSAQKQVFFQLTKHLYRNDTDRTIITLSKFRLSERESAVPKSWLAPSWESAVRKSKPEGGFPAGIVVCRKGGWYGWKPSLSSNLSIRVFSSLSSYWN